LNGGMGKGSQGETVCVSAQPSAPSSEPLPCQFV
jgi:hypothetical protein